MKYHSSLAGLALIALTYAPGAELLFKLSGKNTVGIVVRNTDLKAARQPVALTAGATREALQLP